MRAYLETKAAAVHEEEEFLAKQQRFKLQRASSGKSGAFPGNPATSQSIHVQHFKTTKDTLSPGEANTQGQLGAYKGHNSSVIVDESKEKSIAESMPLFRDVSQKTLCKYLLRNT